MLIAQGFRKVASDETPRGLRIKSERKQRVLVKHSVSASQKKGKSDLFPQTLARP